MPEKPPLWRRAFAGTKEALQTASKKTEVVTKRITEELEKDAGLSRRQVVKGIGATAAVGVAGGIVLDSVLREGGTPLEKAPGFPEAGERFRAVVADYERVYTTLSAKEIQFTDEEGVSIGKPIPIEPFSGVSPGEVDADGIVTGRLNQPWLDAVRQAFCKTHTEAACDPEHNLPSFYNFSQIIRRANEGEPGTEAKTLADIARYNGRKPVVGAGEHISRIDYLKEHANDHTSFPDVVAKEIARYLPALAAQESQYSNESDSGVARGILQFRDAEWASLGYTENDRKFLTTQTEAASRLLQAKYEYLQTHAASELSELEKRFFTSREEYEVYFLAPVIINAYNSGEGNLTAVLKWFTGTYPDAASLSGEVSATNGRVGYDVYAAMARLARKAHATPSYGRDSSQYVGRIMAWRHILKT